jgi:hypothetical protein
MEAFHLQAVERYKSFKNPQLHQYITRKLTAWCKLYHPKQPSVGSADDEDIDSAEGDIMDVPAGGVVHSQSFTMSGDEEEEESAATAAAVAPAPAAAANNPFQNPIENVAFNSKRPQRFGSVWSNTGLITK